MTAITTNAEKRKRGPQKGFGGRKREGGIVVCVHCGKERFLPPCYAVQKYCSRACYFEAKKEERVKNGEARCAKCRTWKKVEEFVRGIGGRPHSYCKPCSSEWFHERRGTPVRERKLYRPAYRLTEEEKRENKRQANHLAHQKRRAAGPAPGKLDVSSMLCRQDFQCAYCGVPIIPGKRGFHIDHKLPVSRGGTNDYANLQILCGHCNMAKGAMTDEEFLVSKKNRRRYPRVV